MPLSHEQVEEFNKIKNEILRRYNRAKVYRDIFSFAGDPKEHFVSGPLWINTTNALEPLTKILNELDLKESDDPSKLKDFAHQWQETMGDLSKIHGDLGEFVDMAYDDVWDNLSELDSSVNNFLNESGLQTETEIEKPQGIQEGIKGQKSPQETQNHESASPELVEKFNKIKTEFINRYNSAKEYAEHGKFTSAYTSIAKSFEPVIKSLEQLDISKPYDPEKLKAFEKVYQDMQLDAKVTDMLRYENAMYPEVFDGLNDLDDLADKFFQEINGSDKLNQQQKEVLQGQQEEEGRQVFQQRASHGIDAEKKQTNSDVSQKAPNVLKREDKLQDKKETSDTKTNEEIIDALAGVLKHHNDHDPDSFRKMMFEIRNLAESDTLPEDMKQEYRDVFNWVKESGSERVQDGANRLNKVIRGQIKGLENTGKEKQEPGKQHQAKEDDFTEFNMGGSLHTAASEKKQTKADVSQRPVDELKREDKSQEEKGKTVKDQEKKRALDNFTKGNQKVLNMDDEREGKRKELNQAALAAYRRRVLEGRGTSNV